MGDIKQPRVLFYDIETNLCKAFLFKVGDQVVRHGQLQKGFNMNPIICLSYAIDNGPIKTLIYDVSTGSCKQLIQDFDEIVKNVDIVIGKNSNRFDNKHINFQRMLHDLPGNYEWLEKCDDLETQMRRYFYMQSHSLDYFSEIKGLGGKVKMDFSDWVDILIYQSIKQLEKKLSSHLYPDSIPIILDEYCTLEYNISLPEALTNGLKALKKMVFYNKKDVRDTRTLWNYCKNHFKLRFNIAAFNRGTMCCIHCGSTKLKKNGDRTLGKTTYKQFHCNEHGGYAGKLPLRKDGTTDPNGILS